MGVLFGGLTSLLYGVGDYVGGRASRSGPAPGVVLIAGVVALPLIAITALVVGGEATATDWSYGAISGSCGAIGLALLFAGLARGRAASVAPVAAAVGAVVPVVSGVVLGERPSLLAWTGVALAIPAIVMCSWGPSTTDTVKGGGAWYGVVAGILFGSYTVIISRTGAASNLLPLIPARGATIVVMLALGLGGAWKLRMVRDIPLGLAAAHGLLDVAGNVALLLGLRVGSLVSVSMAASVTPAVTVAIARFVDREHLRPVQVAGVFLTLVALALIAAG